ncbi:MAG: PqqD family protein, partial [Pseudomonadota bacterium]
MSGTALFSDQWYRVKDLKPTPRRQLKVHRHYYRGAAWYVVEAPSRTQQLRLNDAAYHVFSQLDGTRTVEEIWQRAMSTLGDDAPTQQEVINLLAELAEYGMATFG